MRTFELLSVPDARAEGAARVPLDVLLRSEAELVLQQDGALKYESG